MSPRAAWRAYRPLFAVSRPVSMRVVDTQTDWVGLFLPGPRAATVLINVHLATTPDLVKATVLHELIHAEQWSLGLPTDHGAYFTTRKKELQAITGLII